VHGGAARGRRRARRLCQHRAVDEPEVRDEKSRRNDPRAGAAGGVAAGAGAGRGPGARRPARRGRHGQLRAAARRLCIYTVVLIDASGRKVRLRSATDGKTADVQVGEDVYDLSKLKIGDKVRVEFLAADTPNQKPVAASLWPEK
jgi:hypothetical protein